jgi:hypothetical protein
MSDTVWGRLSTRRLSWRQIMRQSSNKTIINNINVPLCNHNTFQHHSILYNEDVVRKSSLFLLGLRLVLPNCKSHGNMFKAVQRHKRIICSNKTIPRINLRDLSDYINGYSELNKDLIHNDCYFGSVDTDGLGSLSVSEIKRFIR